MKFTKQDLFIAFIYVSVSQAVALFVWYVFDFNSFVAMFASAVVGFFAYRGQTSNNKIKKQ